MIEVFVINNEIIKNDLEGHPRSASSPTFPGSNWKLEMMVFEEREKWSTRKNNLLAQRREPATNSTLIMALMPGFEPRATLVGAEGSHLNVTLEASTISTLNIGNGTSNGTDHFSFI